MRQRFANIVHQRRPSRQLDVEAEFRGHHTAQESGLEGMLPLVLRVTRAVVQPTDELHDVRMRLGNLELLERASAEGNDLAVEIRGNLLHPIARVVPNGSGYITLGELGER